MPACLEGYEKTKTEENGEKSSHRRYPSVDTEHGKFRCRVKTTVLRLSGPMTHITHRQKVT